jgi:thiol-disulfide isomerase/thioredoxin
LHVFFTALAAGAASLALGLGTGLVSWPSPDARPAMTSGTVSAGVSGPLSSLLGARQWLNGKPLRAEDLRGKVVLVNFWTYSCINSLRPLPYLRAWADKYGKNGLVVIGVHTPEFGFEKDLGNVRKAIMAQGIGYPVTLDSDFAVWRSFGNRGWPGFYFIGADGRVRHAALGEGDYAASEQLIQKLLAEAGAPANGPIAEVPGQAIQAAADWASLRSPETYLGHAQAQNFASPGGARADVASQYRAPAEPALNHWGLAGSWTIGGEFATLDSRTGSIRYRFHARDLHLVLGAPANGRPARFRVTVDGAAPGADHGSDVDAEGMGIVREDRLYQLIRQARPVADRTFEIEFLDPGVRAYVFTFG